MPIRSFGFISRPPSTVKNALCPPISYWDENKDYLTSFLATMTTSTAVAAHPTLANWTKTSRLNPISGVGKHKADPRVIASRERIRQFGVSAAMNLQKLVS